MSLGKLNSIPGVGTKTAAKLVEYFGSEEEALESEEHVVLVLKRSIYDLEAEAEFVEVFHGAPSLNELVPELVTQVFTQNAKTVLALDALAKCLGKFPDVPAVNRIRSRIDADALGRILEALNELGTDPGSERGKEAARIERALGKVGNAIRESETEVNAEVERYLSTYEARVSGETIAELLREASAKSVSPERLMAVIPGEVLERIRGMVRQAERSLKERLSLDAAEAEWLEGIFPDSVSL
ncbi:MAG: hypothetical protein QXF24_03305, partial [Thermoproteota archaeon]